MFLVLMADFIYHEDYGAASGSDFCVHVNVYVLYYWMAWKSLCLHVFYRLYTVF